jgi:ferritin
MWESSSWTAAALIATDMISRLPSSSSSSSSFSPLSVSMATPPKLNGAATPRSTPLGPSKELLELFNRQVTQEFIASQVYLSASIWFDTNDWEGMAAYMLAESTEERIHGLGFVDFANKRNFPIELQTIPAPVSSSVWDSPEDVWLSILELEQTNTRSLLDLAEAANDCHDFSVLAFLNPFHMGQVNEEDKIGSILAKVRDENRTPGLLRSLDAVSSSFLICFEGWIRRLDLNYIFAVSVLNYLVRLFEHFRKSTNSPETFDHSLPRIRVSISSSVDNCLFFCWHCSYHNLRSLAYRNWEAKQEKNNDGDCNLTMIDSETRKRTIIIIIYCCSREDSSML